MSGGYADFTKITFGPRPAGLGFGRYQAAKAAHIPFPKPAAALILKDLLFCLQFARYGLFPLYGGMCSARQPVPGVSDRSFRLGRRMDRRVNPDNTASALSLRTEVLGGIIWAQSTDKPLFMHSGNFLAQKITAEALCGD